MKLISILCLVSLSLSAPYTIRSTTNTYNELKHEGIIQSNKPVKLHLGCGQTYFTGFINIDFPPAEHTVQTESKADVFADITGICFPQASVDHIESHHVFEHFSRPVALALLAAWHTWLKQDGILVIETPDLEESMQLLLNKNISYLQKQSILRHIFGSHEASWAVHWDGWYQEKFKHVLESLGFTLISCEKTSWKMTRNISIKAQKTTPLSPEQCVHQCKALLKESLVDFSSSEQQMLATWMHDYLQAYNALMVH